MFTRQFIIVLAVAAIVAGGLGMVIGSRTGSDVVQNSAKSLDPKPADAVVAVPEETIEAPKTKPVALGKAEDAKRDKSDKAAQPKVQVETAKADARQPKSPDAGQDASVLAPQPHPAASDATPSNPSDFVFVSRSSLLKARHATDEAAAIATLRWISSAQAIVVSAGVIDTDGDSAGEYAYFGELSGAVPYRPAPGDTAEPLRPPIIDNSFAVTSSGNVVRSGYVFRMFLPGPSSGSKTPGIPEAPGGGANWKGLRPDHDNCEIFWSCYAWPLEAGSTGTRAFFINQEGDMLVLANEDGAYNGEAKAPAFDAASTRPGNMDAEPLPGAKRVDGRLWTAYQGPEPDVEPFVEIGPATKADAEKYNKPDSTLDKVVVPRNLIVQSTMAHNEGDAISKLRAIATAQMQAQSVASIDTDKDEHGEFGYFGELAGTVPCRAPAGGKRAMIQRATLAGKWGKVTDAGNVVMDGYTFRMYLPAGTTAGKTPGLAEAAGGGCVASGARPDHDNAEILWVVYAWPTEFGKTGRRAFFTNQEGAFMVMENADGFYNGEAHAPTFDAAFDKTMPGDMNARLCEPGAKGCDGHVWQMMGM